MGLEANVVYLEEEIASLQDRIAAIQNFLQANPSVSIYRRSIRGKNYYYKKYRKGIKSISEFLGSGDFDYKGASRKLKVDNEKVKKAKEQLARLKKEMSALEKQAKIARKAFEHVRV
jgi:chromosome segregation ATPase